MERQRRGAQHPYPRTARLNALLREVLAEEIERAADVDERLAMATVTGVECAPDLKGATVFLSSLGPDLAEALEEHRRAFQRSIGAQARLKRVPLLRFLADPAVEAGERIEAALRRAQRRGDAS